MLFVFGGMLLFCYLAFLYTFFGEGLALVSALFNNTSFEPTWNALGHNGQMLAASSALTVLSGIGLSIYRWSEKRPWQSRLTGARLNYHRANFVSHFTRQGMNPAVVQTVYMSLQASAPIDQFPVVPEDPLDWYMKDTDSIRPSVARSAGIYLSNIFSEGDLEDPAVKIPDRKELKHLRTVSDLVQLVDSIRKGVSDPKSA